MLCVSLIPLNSLWVRVLVGVDAKVHPFLIRKHPSARELRVLAASRLLHTFSPKQENLTG